MTDVSHHDARSSDGVRIHYEVRGSGATTLVFVHGWLGSGLWWDDACRDLGRDHRTVALDLAGHGRSSEREHYTVHAYADDIVAVTEASDAKGVVLVGHSMSGAHVLAAAGRVRDLRGVVLVDTLKNLDARQPPERIEAMLALYRSDFETAVKQVIPPFLYSPSTPPAVIDRLATEFLRVSGVGAAARLELYLQHDARENARRIAVPVRAIDGDMHAAALETSRRYFRDFARREIAGCGHYPMLEQPDRFVSLLRESLVEIEAG